MDIEGWNGGSPSSDELAAVYDVVVTSGGVAGLSWALVLGRSRRRVAVIDAGSPRNAPAAGVHNFLTRDGEDPLTLLDQGRAEVRGCGGPAGRGRAPLTHPARGRCTADHDAINGGSRGRDYVPGHHRVHAAGHDH
jgi:hypothetical protein